VIRKSILALVVVMVSACATESTPMRWVKPGAGPEEFATAQTQCNDSAMQPDLGVDGDLMQSQGRANVFMRCMREKGWEQVAADPNG
jgi:hypothetical protein